MIPAVERVLRHLSADFLKCSAVSVLLSKQLAEPIVAPFKFFSKMRRDRVTQLFVHELHAVDIVHVVHEPPHLLGDFALCITEGVNRRGRKLADVGQLPRDAKKQISIGQFLGH